MKRMSPIYHAISKKSTLLAALLLIPFLSFAESKSGEFPVTFHELLLILVLLLLGFVLLVLGYATYLFTVFMREIKPSEAQESFWSGISRKLSGSVPVEHEEAILTDHVYDGIRELDNDLPPWWKYMFYLTIVFSVAYIYFYHYSDYRSGQEQEYQEELVIAQKQMEEYALTAANSIDENNVKVLTTAKVLDNGKKIFSENCAACHGKIGEGGVGPNLTDEYWLHGGGVKNVFKTIKLGVPAKGMISWKSQLSPSSIQDVTNYILSLKGSNPANPKEPQGDLFKE